MAEMIAGAAIGAAFGELLNAVLQVGGTVIGLNSSLRYLTNTLRLIAPIVEEIEQLNHDLGRPKKELESLIRLMEKGTKHVRKYSDISKWNLPVKLYYKFRLHNLAKSLIQFSLFDMQVHNTRDQKETLLKVTRILSAVKYIAGTSSGRVIQDKIVSDIYYSATSELDDENYALNTNSVEEAVELICQSIRNVSCESDDPNCFDGVYFTEHETGKGKAKAGNNPRRQGKARARDNPRGQKSNLDKHLSKIDELTHEVNLSH